MALQPAQLTQPYRDRGRQLAEPRSAARRSGSTRATRPSTASTSSSPPPAARAGDQRHPGRSAAARWPSSQSAINAVRGNRCTAPVMARREQDFRCAAGPARHGAAGVPRASAWLALLRQDFAEAVRLRLAPSRATTAPSGPEWHSLLEESAALIAAIQQQLQKPARLGLVKAAQHAATAAEVAENTLRTSAAAVLGLLLLVSVLLTVSISLPIRRLTAATRRLTAGRSRLRAPRAAARPRSTSWPNPSTPWPTRSPPPKPSCARIRRSSRSTSPNARASCITSRITTRSRSCPTAASSRRASPARWRAPAAPASSSRCCSWTSTTSSPSTTRSATTSATGCCSSSPSGCARAPAHAPAGAPRRRRVHRAASKT